MLFKPCKHLKLLFTVTMPASSVTQAPQSDCPIQSLTKHRWDGGSNKDLFVVWVPCDTHRSGVCGFLLSELHLKAASQVLYRDLGKVIWSIHNNPGARWSRCSGCPDHFLSQSCLQAAVSTLLYKKKLASEMLGNDISFVFLKAVSCCYSKTSVVVFWRM